jgi:hypothetical protein
LKNLSNSTSSHRSQIKKKIVVVGFSYKIPFQRTQAQDSAIKTRSVIKESMMEISKSWWPCNFFVGGFLA